MENKVGKIKILVADQNEIARAGIKALLTREKNLHVVATSCNAEETFLKIRRKNPDIVVLDLCSSNYVTGETVQYITDNFSEVRTIIFTKETDKRCIAEGYRAGAWGYVIKNKNIRHLKEAINAVSVGEKYAGSNVMDICLGNFIDIISNGDTEKEGNIEIAENDKKIIKFLCEGKKLQEIAEKLNIKIRSVSKRKNKIMKRLQVKDIVGLVKYAIKKEIITV